MKNSERFLLPTKPGVPVIESQTITHFKSAEKNIHIKKCEKGSKTPQAQLLKSSFSCDQRISQHDDDGVTPQEHFRNIAILVHRLRLLLPLPALWNLCPHFLHILQDHVTMPEN